MAWNTPVDVLSELDTTTQARRMGRLHTVQSLLQPVVFVRATQVALELRRNRPKQVEQQAGSRSIGYNELWSFHRPRDTCKTVCIWREHKRVPVVSAESSEGDSWKECEKQKRNARANLLCCDD